MSGEIHALSGAYAVDALDDLERAQVERHLADCGSCRAEVESLRETASLLAHTSARPAPEALRSRVLAHAAQVRPLPPLVAGAHRLRAARHRRAPRLIAAAVALIALGGAGATVWHPWTQDTAPVTAAQRIQEAPDAETVTKDLRDGATLTIVRSKSLNQAIISSRGLDTLPDGLTYELWLIHDGRYIPAGLMDGDASSVLLDGDPRSATGAGITIEPDGGSPSPSLGQTVAVMAFGKA